jgi:hypothetical protein
MVIGHWHRRVPRCIGALKLIDVLGMLLAEHRCPVLHADIPLDAPTPTPGTP